MSPRKLVTDSVAAIACSVVKPSAVSTSGPLKHGRKSATVPMAQTAGKSAHAPSHTSVAANGSKNVWRWLAVCAVAIAASASLAIKQADSVCPAGYTDRPLSYLAAKNDLASSFTNSATSVLARMIVCRTWSQFSTADDKLHVLAQVPSAVTRMATSLSYPKTAMPAASPSAILPDSMMRFYAKGPADIYFILGGIVALSVLQSLLGLLVRNIEHFTGTRIGKVAHTESRFIEQAYLLGWYFASIVCGAYIYYNSNYFPLPANAVGLWSKYPEQNLVGYIKAYYLIQLSFWTQQFASLAFLTVQDDRRKDHWPMVCHHIITIMLISASYVVHMTPVGVLVLLVMDAADMVLSLAKCLKYMGPKFQKMCDLTFTTFVLVWILTRHILFCFLMYAIFWVGPSTLEHITWDPWFTREVHSMDDLERPGTYITPNTWVFYKVLFTGLQILLLYWLMLLCRVAIRVINGSGAQDVREDQDD